MVSEFDTPAPGTPASDGFAVAVIGIACRLPGAPDPATFWRNLRQGTESLTEPPADRWNVDEFYDADRNAPGRTNARRGGYLDSVDRFDPAFFGISPREAAAMDPQQRLILELSWEALEDSRIVPATLRDSGTGVFIGAIWDDYATLLYRHGPQSIGRHTVTGLHRSIIANRVSYTLGLHGPSLAVDAAQSSSLVSVHLACESLRRGESALALAGGVNLNIVPESTVGAAKFGGLSPDGRCHTFDARANGYARGEGAGLVVLKPLRQAIADGDRIHCVIRGSAMNNDGATDGLTVPGRATQEAVIRQALQRSGVTAEEVQYVELHGTGTPLGDPIEAAALGAAIGSAHQDGHPLAVGSAKTNIGHLEGAAGIAGLLKAILSIKHRELPPSLNFETPNPDIPLDALNLRVQTGLSGWPRPDRPLIAGVSSFGMGGTNAHVVLEEAPELVGDAEPATDTEPVAGGVVPWVVSARSAAALRGQAARLVERLSADVELRPADVGLSLAVSRARFSHRAVIVGEDRADLLAGVEALSRGEDAANVVSGVQRSVGGTAFLFAGQGSQRVGMGRGLYASFPVFAEAFDAVGAAFDGLLELPLSEAIGGGVVHETGFTQPGLFAVEVALFRLWESWGVVP
ncbi:type I polyketide synthase, partial [Streptomyces sp. AK02-01A]|uniref:type I polyketide synthase n=1 Tax=Streptomyces sp. AK02-01A TaxID=3028648 RepID=UPI0029B7B3B2